MDDKKLRQDVLDELEFEPSVDAANIGVSVDDGVVTLTGHVSSFAEKIAAENAVRHVKGVLAIAEAIEVRYPDDKKTSDDEIAKRAVSILKWYNLIPQSAVHVTVQKGWVTLTGEVPWQYQKKAAQDAVRKLSGIAGVINNILIKPLVYVTDVKKKIEDALTRRTKVEAQDIRVTVRQGNMVSLEGKVDSWEEREAAESAAWSVAGVQFVDDRLSVGTVVSPPRRYD
jgi:osmotically-inducible protein OsmY